MEEKISDKIKRRLEILPKHHIDTSIFLEPINIEDSILCRKYLQRVAYNYRGIVSFPVLSELMFVFLRIEKYDKRMDILDLVYDIIKTRKISLYAQKNIENIMITVNHVDPRVDSLDREIIACAIEDKADVFVTLDKNLIRN